MTIIMITPGRLILKLTLITFFCLQVQNFLISSQVDKEFIIKHIKTKFLWPLDELVHETVNY